jgi:DNA-binding beta-propeller fold protein YncE
MPISAASPPQSVPISSFFDYMTADAARRRVYAAHTSSSRLLVVDSSAGAIAGQVRVGSMHGVAVDPQTGNIFTGSSDGTISLVDPVALKVLATVKVGGPVDAIAYDASHRVLYADEGMGGARLFVVDATSMKVLSTLTLPSHYLESPAVDPATGTLYQNLADRNGFAIVHPPGQLVKVIATPQLTSNHPLVFSAFAQQVIAGGLNGLLGAYTVDGEHVGDVSVQPNIDQCSTGERGQFIACAGRGVVSVLAARKGSAPQVIGTFDTGHAGVHTIAMEEASKTLWIVWSDERGDWVQRLSFTAP